MEKEFNLTFSKFVIVGALNSKLEFPAQLNESMIHCYAHAKF